MLERVFRETFSRFKNSSEAMGLIDEKGVVVSSNHPELVGSIRKEVVEYINRGIKEFCLRNTSYMRLDGEDVNFLIFYDSISRYSENFCRLLNYHAKNIQKISKDEVDKSRFFKEIVNGTILSEDINSVMKRFNLSRYKERVLVLVETKKDDLENIKLTLQKLFKNNEYVSYVVMNDIDILIVKEILPKSKKDDVEKFAKNVYEQIKKDKTTDVIVTVSDIFEDILKLSRSFAECKICLEVVPFTCEKVLCYNSLGIGRLICQLPKSVCRLFLKETLKRGTISMLSQDMLETIEVFYENSLNISASAKALFLHRNTLIYRLTKIKKITGLDLQNFNDAIIFKMAMMINSYLGDDEYATEKE